MTGWNFADVWETVASATPDALALAHGPLERTWAELDRRADGVARAILDAGVADGETVAQYLHNRPEYLESVFAAFKLGLAPVNTNYRYVDDELVYLWDNADTAVVVFDEQYTEMVSRIRSRVPGVRLWLRVGSAVDCPDWARDYESAAGVPPPSRVAAPWGRDGDRLFLLYTGGTTGMPKGVMWRNDDLMVVLNRGAPKARWLPEEPSLDAVRSILSTGKPGPVALPACPLMHGTGMFNAMTVLAVGGAVVTLTGARFAAEELLDTIEARRVNTIAIVGDAFAKPILAALDAEPHRWDLSSLKVVVSSGVMWSQATKEGILRHHPRALLVDSLGSSEAIGMASSVSTGGSASTTASFSLGEDAVVIADDGTLVTPGSDLIGKVALRGRTPVGYYKDPEKSAATFAVVDGVRYSMPGDYARIEADGTIVLLGRGSVCINTGGEKVFPEEVEEVLKEHPLVHDAIVVGVPDDRFGQSITAVVEPEPGSSPADDELIAHVKGRLAHYKAPRAVVLVPTLARAANGKVDYKRWTEHAAASVDTTR